MRPSQLRLHLTLAVCALSAILALAALPSPYDFTGHWSGVATSQGQSFSLTADFASTSNPRKFTGTTTLADGLGNHISCTLTAKYKRKLKLHTVCDNGRTSTVIARLDTTTQTLTGSFLIGRRHPRLAMFTLMKASG